MNRNIYICLTATLFIHLANPCLQGQTQQPCSRQTSYTKQPPLPGRDYDPEGGADAYACRGDNRHSAYYVNPDFFHLTSNDTLTLLTHFPTMQQTTEWSCGDVAALLVLRHFGCTDETEWTLACALHSMTDRTCNDLPEGEQPGTSTGRQPDGQPQPGNTLQPGSQPQPGTACRICDYGTRLEDLHHYFAARSDFRIIATSYRPDYTPADLIKDTDLYPSCDRGNLPPTFASPDTFAPWLTAQLRHGRPVLAEWSDWDGHWVIIIGLDNNGTPDFCGDDILIFADPYDTSDHWQDGYSIAPLERFFYSWKDRAIAPKPYQLQPFLVVEPRSRQPQPQASHPDTLQLWKDYRAAVADASVAEASEISRTLPAITCPGDTPLIEWTTEEGHPMVLVASMTDAEEADKWHDGNNDTGTNITTTVPSGSLPWVTLPYDLEAHLLRLPPCTDSLECRLRMIQLLGLPPDCDYDRILFFYAERDSLFRPTPDPEIDDHEASLRFPTTTPKPYRKWFTANCELSYRSSTPYPWTRLGYTYDWHRGAATVQGPGEFIVRPGARVRVKRKITVWKWYRQHIYSL